ncbi:MAG: hypothetical protein IKJ41_10240 [Clostridia bacterium]|nr:hypothetical protein [Clostridia bacterium]
MKRVLSITMILAVLFSFASCRNIKELNEETTTVSPIVTAAPPIVNEKKQSKEFKDANGRTVYVVDVVLPEISENIEQSMIDYVNGVINKFFEDACTQAQSNLEAASNFMDKHNSDKPWRNTITFEAKYVSGYFVSFLIKDSLSYYGSSNNSPSVYSRCFQVQEGNPVNAAYFTDVPENPEVATSHIADLLKSRANANFYGYYYDIDEEILAAFDEAVSIENFYLTENGMAFYVSKSAVDQYEIEGIYTEEFTWDELAGLFNKPELY